jgi:hypothetical protein
VSGPHDFAVRCNISRQHAVDRSQAFRQPALQSHRAQNAAASTATHPAFVTIMIRPSCGVGWRECVEMICPTGEAKYFCKGDWTAQITLIWFNNFSRARMTMPSSLRENLGIAPQAPA